MNKHNYIKTTITLISLAAIALGPYSTLALSWDGEYTLRDLELTGTDFVDQEVPYWNLSSYYSSSHKKYYNCDGAYLLGGYKVLGQGRGQYFERIYSDLPGHNQIEMQITFYPLDSWDGDGSDDHFNVYFDGTSHTAWKLEWQESYAYAQCGNDDYSDLPPILATITIPHSASNLTFRVVSGLDEDTADESLGFRGIVMNFVNVSTPTYSLCGVVNTGVLPNQACLCPATNMYMDPLNSGCCSNCNGICATCSGPTSTQCTSCYNSTYLISGTCKPCDSSCLTCNGSSASNCLSCSSTSYLIDQTCSQYCPEPFYSTDLVWTKTCETNCPGEFAYKDGTCSPDCVSPYGPFYTVSLEACVCYNGGQEICYACDSSCATCKGQEATQCATCPDRHYLTIIDTSNSTGTCEACDPSCLTCNGPDTDQCLTCDPYFYLVNDTSVNGTCQPCAGTCLTCDGPNANQCLTCANGFYLSPNSIAGEDGTCNQCDPSCATCEGSSAQQCLTCASGSYLVNNNTCVTSCSSPFFITSDGVKDFCETPCSNSQIPFAYESGYCQSDCGNNLYRNETVSVLKACYCDYYEYWNTSCLAICNFPLVSNRTEGTRRFCDYPCASNEYLNSDGSCSSECEFPLVAEIIAFNNYCVSKGCTGMKITYVKATTQGYQYKLQFTADSCDWDATYLQGLLNANPTAHMILGDFSFAVTRTQAALYILDLTVSQSILGDKNLNLTFGTLSGEMLVYQKFSPTALALKLTAIAQSVQTIITAATGATFVSALVMQSTTSVWGFVGFQQFINFLKYINVQYPAQMEMLFVLGGGTKFNSTIPNVLDTVTQSAYNVLMLDEDLVDEQAPPRKFADYDETSFYIKNGGSIILMNLVFLIITTLIALLRKIKVVRENKIFGMVDVNLRWNFLLRSFLTTSIPLGVAICLQLRRLAFEYSTYLTISSLLTTASAIYFVIMSAVMVRILYTREPEEFKKKECLDVYGTLTKGLDVKNCSTKYYYMLILLRGVIISVMIVFAQDSPLLQILGLLFANVGLFAYIFRNVNFANPKETRKTLITEFFIIIAEILIALLTAKNKSEQYYDIVAWCIVGIIGLMFINELVFIVLMQIAAISSLIQTLKEKLKKKSNVKSNEKEHEQEQEKPNESFIELALPTSPQGETPIKIKDQDSISGEQPQLFMDDEDQPSPENIARLTVSKNIDNNFYAKKNLHLPLWSPIISRRQTTSNLLTTPVTPLSGDNPPPLFEDPNSIIVEEPAGSINAERFSTILPMADRKTAQEFNSDPYE